MFSVLENCIYSISAYQYDPGMPSAAHADTSHHPIAPADAGLAMTWNADRPFQSLALTGGGYRGLFTARVLDVIEEHLGEPIGRRFDLISGTSIGRHRGDRGRIRSANEARREGLPRGGRKHLPAAAHTLGQIGQRLGHVPALAQAAL
jgi:hypothetical protein